MRAPVRSNSEGAKGREATSLVGRSAGVAGELDLDEIERSMEGLTLSNGYLYLDEIGQTKWQGEYPI